MTPTEVQPAPPRYKLRWYQYSLRSLMLFVTACAIACSWLGVTIQGQRRQGAAAEAIKKAGGSVESEQTWLGKLLRDGSLVNVTTVSFYGESTTDAVMAHLRGLSQLQSLALDNTKVTDAGLVYLQELSQLQELYLDNTQVTDAGLVHLRGLSQLRWLSLADTQVTDAGVKKFQQALPKCNIGR